MVPIYKFIYRSNDDRYENDPPDVDNVYQLKKNWIIKDKTIISGICQDEDKFVAFLVHGYNTDDYYGSEDKLYKVNQRIRGMIKESIIKENVKKTQKYSEAIRNHIAEFIKNIDLNVYLDCYYCRALINNKAIFTREMFLNELLIIIRCLYPTPQLYKVDFIKTKYNELIYELIKYVYERKVCEDLLESLPTLEQFLARKPFEKITCAYFKSLLSDRYVIERSELYIYQSPSIPEQHVPIDLNQPSLTDLPLDIMTEILVHCDIETIRTLCIANSKVRQMCLTPMWWKLKYEYDYEEEDDVSNPWSQCYKFRYVLEHPKLIYSLGNLIDHLDEGFEKREIYSAIAKNEEEFIQHLVESYNRNYPGSKEIEGIILNWYKVKNKKIMQKYTRERLSQIIENYLITNKIDPNEYYDEGCKLTILVDLLIHYVVNYYPTPLLLPHTQFYMLEKLARLIYNVFEHLYQNKIAVNAIKYFPPLDEFLSTPSTKYVTNLTVDLFNHIKADTFTAPDSDTNPGYTIFTNLIYNINY